METPNKDTNKQEVCSITILFPVDTDEQAIAVKKQIGDILSTIPDTRIEFRLSELPVRPELKR